MIRKILNIGVGLAIALSMSATTQAEDSCKYHPNPIPDTGLYWFSDNETKVKFDANPGQNFFDPNKKTLIFAHGWQKGSIAKGSYERFDYENHDCHNGFNDDLVKIWKDKGWNVGTFFWREHADEPLPNLPEAKIWNVNRIAGNKTVADMFVEDYKAAMSNHGNQEIRLAGHSLGSQLILAAGQKIHTDPSLSNNQKPKRLALIDPAFSNIYVKDLTTSGTLGVQAARTLKDRGVALEYYRVSEVNLGSQVLGVSLDGTAIYRLRQVSAFAELQPWYIEGVAPFNAGDKHIAAPYLYFDSMRNSRTPEVTLGDWVCHWIFCRWDATIRKDTYRHALSAATPTHQVRADTGANHYWVQIDGRQSGRTYDDKFLRKRRW